MNLTELLPFRNYTVAFRAFIGVRNIFGFEEFISSLWAFTTFTTFTRYDSGINSPRKFFELFLQKSGCHLSIRHSNGLCWSADANYEVFPFFVQRIHFFSFEYFSWVYLVANGGASLEIRSLYRVIEMLGKFFLLPSLSREEKLLCRESGRTRGIHFPYSEHTCKNV